MDQLLYMKYERGIETKQKARTKKIHTRKKTEGEQMSMNL